MAGQRQPLELIQAKGAKHLTKSEIERRKNTEVKPITDNIIAPNYLSKKQQAEFDKIANQLEKLKIMGETDVDALARYIIARDFYINAIKQMRKTEVKNNPDLFSRWANIQERYYKQCRSSANDLGLSITSRCKIVVPKVEAEAPKQNKFSRFEKVGGA